MKRTDVLTRVCPLLFLSVILHASLASTERRLPQLTSFAFALGADIHKQDTIAALQQFDLVVVDGAETRRAEVDALKSRSVVLAYVSVGTIERRRSWYKRAKPYRLDLWGDWGEWYADTSKEGYRNLIRRSVAPALLRKGFDGLFLDNVDMIATHPRQRQGMFRLVRALGNLVHGRGGYLFAQNGEDVIEPVFRQLDGWNREDVTSTYEFKTGRYRLVPEAEVRKHLESIASIKARGIVVTATDYTAGGDESAAALSKQNACSAGAISFVSDIYLRRLPAPLKCAG